VPDVDDVETSSEGSSTTSSESMSSSADDASETPKEQDDDDDDDEATVEDAEDVKIKVEEEEVKPLKMKTVVTEDWLHLNAQAPIWTR
jgi:heat shock protein 90kDa beta